MKELNNYIIEKLRINKNIQIKKSDGYRDDEVTNDFRKMIHIIKNIHGKDSEIINYIVDMMEWEDEDNVDSDVYYKFDEDKFYLVLREIVNYDLISLYGGKVNISESNNKDLAKIIKKYATPELIKRVQKSFGWI